ncbi:MAG: KpsF/GutQ family sugar-phosphate isomerase [Rhodospirillales bacterium]|nr:KpsF/GutQ family sugar-phosphate isomerase [Rhodospirillales bacterium]
MKAQAKKISETATSDLSAGRRVLELEAAGLGALGQALDGGFVAAVERILGIDGRVVVSGMGKSGHVARKIAATLASTGTPALYVHPGEASHGDLGMITRHDAVLALSNSGNTPELSDIVAYSRRFGICLIGMTSVAGSPLAEQADVALILPKTAEACPMGLAPTTSTTMMMALGDALAIALLERRGFSAQDFQVFHPGGTLGSKLLRVSDVMQRPATLPLCRTDTAMAEAVIAMTRSSGELRSFGCVGIVDENGLLIGIISDGDLRRHMQPDLLERRAGEVMTKGPKTIRPQALVAEALGFMNEIKITSLFVVEDGRPVGFLHMHDCLQAGVT